MANFRVGVDIGGTFTDIVFLGPDGQLHTKKVSSSVDNYAHAIAGGLREVFDETGLSGADVEEIRHGTTVASNAILEHKGNTVPQLPWVAVMSHQCHVLAGADDCYNKPPVRQRCCCTVGR